MLHKLSTKILSLLLASFFWVGMMPLVASAAEDVDITASFTDPDFRAAVYEKIGKTAPEPIFDTDVSWITGLNVSSQNIQSLAGLEYFINLSWFDCSGNELTKLPVLPSGLGELNCVANQLTELPALPEGLYRLQCQGNLLTTLPALPSSLNDLNCQSNRLAELPELPDGLWVLYCSYNSLTTLPTLPFGLDVLSCEGNQLESLPAPLPTNLSSLYCSYNQLESLPALPASLNYLYCRNNRLTSLPALPSGLLYLNCSRNYITALDVTNLKLNSLDCSFNNMTGESAVTGFNGVWDNIYSYVFSPQRTAEGVNITTAFPDLAFRTAVYEVIGKTAPEPIFDTDVSGLGLLNIGFRNIRSLAGLECFTNLKTLMCRYNQITTIPELPASLTQIYVENNLLSSLPELPSGLESLDCSNNRLTSLPELPSSLWILECVNNRLSSLPALPANLEYLYCSDNRLTMLDVTGLIKLDRLDCSYNYMTDTSAVTGFTGIWDSGYGYIYSPQHAGFADITASFTDPNFRAAVYEAIGKTAPAPIFDTDATEIVELNLFGSSIESLAGLEHFVHLEMLNCMSNQLTELPDLPSGLTSLHCGGNQLTQLPDLPSGLSILSCNGDQLTELPPLPSGLRYLSCIGNQLTALPALPTSLVSLNCPQNQLTDLDVTGLDSLEYLDCSYNYIPDESKVVGFNGMWDGIDCRFHPQRNALTNTEIVAADKATLTWDVIKGINTSQNSVKSGLLLPITGGNGSTITWISDDMSIVIDAISGVGLVLRPSSGQGDRPVTLTATITKGEASDTIDFDLIVSEQSPDDGMWVNPFGDVNELDWYYESVAYAHKHCLMNGTSANTFSPNMALTRGAVAVALYHLAGCPDVTNLPHQFSDVKEGLWYADAVKWVVSEEILAGFSDDTFHPEYDVSRQMLMTILARFTYTSGIELPQKYDYPEFIDEEDIADYAKESVVLCYKAGIITGASNNCFYPNRLVSRAEFAAILFRFIETAEIQLTETDPPAVPSLEVAPETLILAANSSGSTVAVTSNTSWTASSDADWLRSYQTKGIGNGELWLYTLGSTEDRRTGTVTVSAGEMIRTITVTQMGTVPIPITSAIINGMVAPVAGAMPISVDALSTPDEGYTITSITWRQEETATPVGTSFAYETSYYAVIELTAQSGYTLSSFPRADSSAITINTGCATAIAMLQAGGRILLRVSEFPATEKDPNFTVSLATWSPPAAATSTTATVTANTAWTANCDKTWLTVSPTNGTGSGTLTLNVAANTGSARTGTVTVKAGTFERTIAVSQAAGESPNGPPSGGGAPATTFIVTFNTNGGSTVPKQSITSGSKATKPADPIRMGYTFEGWYSDAALITSYDFNSAVAANITLFAKWTETVTVTDADPPLAQLTPYTDVSSTQWFYDAVKFVTDSELMTGISDDKFSPNVTMSRAMLVTVLYRLEGKPTVNGDIPFTDVISGQWYSAAILWASQNNIVAGYSSDTFGWNDNVTREQAVTILYRYAKSKGLDVNASVDLSKFADMDDISDWALDAMKWAAAAGIVQGRPGNRVAPLETSTRAEVATIFKRYLEEFLDAGDESKE